MNNDKIRQRLRKHYAAFTRDVDPDVLSDYLKQEDIISIPQWQDICSKNTTTRNRCRALFDLLLTGTNPTAFLIVRNVLEKENNYLLSVIDDDTSSLTEDEKIVRQSQVGLTQGDSLEKRFHEIECEIDKLRKKVAELETERDRYQLKRERQQNKTELSRFEIDKLRKKVAKLETERDRYQFKKDSQPNETQLTEEISEPRKTADEVKESESSYSGFATGGQVREKIAPRRVVSFPDATFAAENERYSVATLKPSDGKSGVISTEHYEPVMYLTLDSGNEVEVTNTDYERKHLLFRETPSFAGTSTAELCGTEPKGATFWPLKSKTSTQSSATFKPSSSRTLLGLKQYEKIEYREDPYIMKVIKTRASRDNCKAIYGLSILDAELFIISQVSSEIEVRNTDRLTLVRRVELKILEAPWDIVSCKINKCLYIMNSNEDQSKTIIRIDPFGNAIKQWSTGSFFGRLSITQDSNIILAAYNENKIIEYSREGHILREIKLSSMIAHPKHAIKLSIGHSLVIHGMGSDVQQRLCLLDTTGCVLTSFGGENGSGRERLHGPIYMAVDKAGTIFVAEYSNSRVLLLSRSLKFMRVLLSKENHGIRYLRSIHLDEANGRLFLVDNNYQEREKILKEGRVLIFHIKS